ncbi:MAG: MerR family transcriptional regulator [Deltaproteobacteria bacterium]|nr:MerR family transcriptional regulator [Deltaproteobacteria bacterium]
MDVTIPEKEYFRIGEVSRILGVEPYVIRYWESEFKSVKPARTKSDQRLYRRKDVQELLIIKDLLYKERFTINGAKKQLQKVKKGGGESGEGQSRTRLMQIRNGLLQIRELVSRKEY